MLNLIYLLLACSARCYLVRTAFGLFILCNVSSLCVWVFVFLLFLFVGALFFLVLLLLAWRGGTCVLPFLSFMCCVVFAGTDELFFCVFVLLLSVMVSCFNYYHIVFCVVVGTGELFWYVLFCEMFHQTQRTRHGCLVFSNWSSHENVRGTCNTNPGYFTLYWPTWAQKHPQGLLARDVPVGAAFGLPDFCLAKLLEKLGRAVAETD